MLDYNEIKYVYDTSLLKRGDILLMNTYHERQRKLMKCTFDHAAIYTGDAFIIEADGLGVVMNHIFSYAFKDSGDACVLRPKNLSPKKVDEVMEFVRSQLGKEYGTGEARAVLRKQNTEEQEHSNRTFCSRLIAQAYNSVGIKIAKNPDYCSPDVFLTSEELTPIVPCVVEANEDIKKTVLHQQKGREDDQDTILQDSFAKFGDLYGEDIQTMSQLLLAAIKCPEKDKDAIKILKEETLLFRPAEKTKKAWPWFDSDEEFFNHFSTTEETLFFILNQFLHYDKTYLPALHDNVGTLSFLQLYHKKSAVLNAFIEGFKSVLDECIRIRKRLECLYIESFGRNESEFKDFASKYGFYSNFEYKEPILNLDKFLSAALKFGLPND